MGDEYFGNMESLTAGGDLGLSTSSSSSATSGGDFSSGRVSMGNMVVNRYFSDDTNTTASSGYSDNNIDSFSTVAKVAAISAVVGLIYYGHKRLKTKKG